MLAQAQVGLYRNFVQVLLFCIPVPWSHPHSDAAIDFCLSKASCMTHSKLRYHLLSASVCQQASMSALNAGGMSSGTSGRMPALTTLKITWSRAQAVRHI